MEYFWGTATNVDNIWEAETWPDAENHYQYVTVSTFCLCPLLAFCSCVNIQHVIINCVIFPHVLIAVHLRFSLSLSWFNLNIYKRLLSHTAARDTKSPKGRVAVSVKKIDLSKRSFDSHPRDRSKTRRVNNSFAARARARVGVTRTTHVAIWRALSSDMPIVCGLFNATWSGSSSAHFITATLRTMIPRKRDKSVGLQWYFYCRNRTENCLTYTPLLYTDHMDVTSHLSAFVAPLGGSASVRPFDQPATDPGRRHPTVLPTPPPAPAISGFGGRRLHTRR